MTFELHYHLTNNGDGSASVHFHEAKEGAQIAEGVTDWGWPSFGFVKLKFEDGQLFFREPERVEGRWVYVWKKAKETTDA